MISFIGNPTKGKMVVVEDQWLPGTSGQGRGSTSKGHEQTL